MPYLTVYTNVELAKGNEFAQKSSELISDVLHKPINYVVSNFIYNPNMSFGGSSSEKGALVELLSIGLGDKDNLVAELTAFLSQNLDIKNVQNINISLNNAPASQVASGGYTFG